jgi:hypothetical protein
MSGRRASVHGGQHGARKRAGLPERDTGIPAFAPVKLRAYGETKTVVGKAVDEAGGVQRVMGLLDRSQSVVYGYTDCKVDRADLTVDQARKLTAFADVRAFAEDFAKLAGGLFVPGPDSEAHSTWAAIGSLCGKDGAAFQGRLLHALQDGEISAAEHRQLEKEVDDLVRAVCAARAKLADRAPPEGAR